MFGKIIRIQFKERLNFRFLEENLQVFLMSESRSTSKSHGSFNQNVIKQRIEEIFPTKHLENEMAYTRFSQQFKCWLSSTDISNMNENDLRLDFYQNCMKKYDEHIDDRLKYGNGFKGTVYNALFGTLMPDFCLVDFYNDHLKSLSSGLDLEFLPMHIVSIFELRKKLRDSDIGQLLHYLRIVLDYSPASRSFILGGITDFQHIQFASVHRSNGYNDQFKYYASNKVLYEDDYILHYLPIFFTIDSSKFGYHRQEKFHDDIRIDRLLGAGANSMAFSCYFINEQQNEYALKISNKVVNKEISIYQKLYADKYHIVQVHPYAFVFLHPPGQIVSKDTLFDNIHQIWNQIKQAHIKKILHRDIRRPNIIEMFNNQTRR